MDEKGDISHSDSMSDEDSDSSEIMTSEDMIELIESINLEEIR